MNFYKIYGLIVKSEFPIPEALEIEKQNRWDVFIEFGEIPEEDRKIANSGKVCRLEPQIMWFYLKELVFFYVENGNHIIVHKESDKLTELARNSYLTGTAMGLLLFQRGIIPIHSGAVAYNGKCITVVGESGAGKSTASMLLQEKGCSLVADDVSAVSVLEERIMVSPAFPQQKLCKDAALRLGYKLEELIYIDEFRDKYAVRLKDGYEQEQLPLGVIVELVAKDCEEFSIKEIVGIEKLKLLFRNIYRGYVLDTMGMPEKMQVELLKIAEKIPMYQCIRPKKGFHMEQIVDWILENGV